MIEPINDTTYEATLLSGDKVEIGDIESTDFKPHIKLNRWGGECFIKVSLPTSRKITPVLEGEKVKWVTQGVEAHLYSLEPTTVIAKDKDGNDVESTQNELGGFEFEIILKKKPVSNKIVLEIETQGLNFYYQPELTQQEIDDGAVRPDNVVGSYAVYHATRTPFHKGNADADKYRAGIAFHIYRPKITDALGNEVWGELSLDESTLTITVDQSWLDSAVYPVTIDPNFGYETIGGSWHNLQYGMIGSVFPGAAGTVDSITVYASGSQQAAAAIYKHSDSTKVDEAPADFGGGATWRTVTFSGSPVISAIDYVLLGADTDGFSAKYDSGDTNQGHTEAPITAGSLPDPASFTHNNRKYSVYCTYTEEAPPEGQPYSSRVQGVAGMATWGGTKS